MLCYLQIVHFVEGFFVCDVKTLLCKYSKKKCLSCSWVLSLSLCWSHLYNNKSVWNLLRKKRLESVSEHRHEETSLITDWWLKLREKKDVTLPDHFHTQSCSHVIAQKQLRVSKNTWAVGARNQPPKLRLRDKTHIFSYILCFLQDNNEFIKWKTSNISSDHHCSLNSWDNNP